MEKAAPSKGRTENRLCWVVCFTAMLIMALVVTTLLGLILRDLRENNGQSGCCSTANTRNDDAVNRQLKYICEATCSRRAQNTSDAQNNPIDIRDSPEQIFRCRACCTLLTQEECENYNMNDTLPQPTCEWVTFGRVISKRAISEPVITPDTSSGGCVSLPGYQTFGEGSGDGQGLKK